jgi:hypothetical protein
MCNVMKVSSGLPVPNADFLTGQDYGEGYISVSLDVRDWVVVSGTLSQLQPDSLDHSLIGCHQITIIGAIALVLLILTCLLVVCQ